MNICFLGGYSGGGTERACFAVANELCKDNNVYILENGYHDPFFQLSSTIKYTKLQRRDIVGRNKEVYNFLKTHNIDVLITLEAMTGIISLVPAKLAGCKHIVWEHANFYQKQGSRYTHTLRKIELKLVDAYVVLTKRDLNNFKKNFKIKCAIDYIYNSVEATDTPIYNSDSKTIISVGHIRKIKNFTAIPDIASLVFEKHPDWRWEIYGDAKGEEYEKLKAKVNDLGLEEKVVFCGRTNDMDSVYRKAAMYVMTSLQEGLPMVLLEAKTRKLPLISFDIETGPDEIIRDGVNGFLVPPYDIEIMAERINSLVEDERLRRSFSDNSQLDMEKFDAEEIANRWKMLIDNFD